MARPHHRKKHKTHVQQFKHSHNSTASVKAKSKASAAGVFTFGGAIAGLLLGYFAGGTSLIWAAAGLIAGGLAGYLIGRRMDAGNAN
ncbi:MAG: hypothetical protein JNK14_13985 [Chitinophagaceae bacterium]|nr:hypothetical protein [Chitinophagaceae bacterium]